MRIQARPGGSGATRFPTAGGFALLLLGPLLAGCLAPAEPLAPALAGPLDALGLSTSAALDLETPAAVRGLAPLGWRSEGLAGHGGQAGCARGPCERIPLALALPADPRAAGLVLEASVMWDYRPDDFAVGAYDLALHPAEGGAAVAEGRVGYLATTLFWMAPRPGAYELRVTPRWEDASLVVPYRGVLQLEAPRAATGPGQDVLPNLVAVEPAHLQVEQPGMRWFALPSGPLSEGCRLEEAVEGGARRCLRFSSGIGNAGRGPLVAALPLGQGPPALLGEGRWTQRILQLDGTHREVEAGAARFHPIHLHYHYEGILEATVYPYDPATGARGAAVTEGRKTGFCFEDWGLVDLGLPGTAGPDHACGAVRWEDLAGGAPDWIEVGVSANWYDLYGWGLADQYVDITGVEDGVYELVVVADPDATLLETDRSDNAVSVVFRLQGNDVEILGPGGVRA